MIYFTPFLPVSILLYAFNLVAGCSFVSEWLPPYFGHKVACTSGHTLAFGLDGWVGTHVPWHRCLLSVITGLALFNFCFFVVVFF